jgi:thiamine biosynthesis protein ThiS
MKVYVNEAPVETAPGTTLEALLKAAGRDPGLVLVTVDGNFVPRSEYRTLAPADGARVKVWELLGGG